MQSTGHTSTQLASFVSMHGSAMMYVMAPFAFAPLFRGPQVHPTRPLPRPTQSSVTSSSITVTGLLGSKAHARIRDGPSFARITQALSGQRAM